MSCGLGFDDGHALLLQLVDVPAVLVLRGFPSARFGVGGRLAARRPGSALSSAPNACWLTIDRVLRQPGLRVVEGLDAFVGLISGCQDTRRSSVRTAADGVDTYPLRGRQGRRRSARRPRGALPRRDRREGQPRTFPTMQWCDATRRCASSRGPHLFALATRPRPKAGLVLEWADPDVDTMSRWKRSPRRCARRLRAPAPGLARRGAGQAAS